MKLFKFSTEVLAALSTVVMVVLIDIIGGATFADIIFDAQKGLLIAVIFDITWDFWDKFGDKDTRDKTLSWKGGAWTVLGIGACLTFGAFLWTLDPTLTLVYLGLTVLLAAGSIAVFFLVYLPAVMKTIDHEWLLRRRFLKRLVEAVRGGRAEDVIGILGKVCSYQCVSDDYRKGPDVARPTFDEKGRTLSQLEKSKDTADKLTAKAVRATLTTIAQRLVQTGYSGEDIDAHLKAIEDGAKEDK